MIPFYVAVHEAGHVVAEWRLGGSFYAVELATLGQPLVDRRGRVHHGLGGHVEGTINYNPYSMLGAPPAYAVFADHPEILAKQRRLGLAAAAVINAGITAEAHYRHCSGAYVALTGGDGDIRHIRAIAADLWPHESEQRAFYKAAEALNRRLLRRQMPLVVSLARELYRVRRLEGDALDELLRTLLGPPAEYLAGVAS